MPNKVYISSSRNDAELEKTIYEMDAYFLRIALYSIARGDSFDDAFGVAEGAAQQVHATDLPVCICLYTKSGDDMSLDSNCPVHGSASR